MSFFQNDTVNMCKSNFEPKIDELKSVINNWQQRHLTLYGKIYIVKCLLLPKLTHLFSTLPNPPIEFTRKVNAILYKFIWNGKRDKIKRRSVVQPVECGGAGMIDIQLYLKSLKLSWVRRLLWSDNQWVALFERKISEGCFIWNRNARSLREFNTNVNFSDFWSDVISAMADFKEAFGKCEQGEMSSCTLWYSDYSKFTNNKINSWNVKGIYFLNDLLDANGNIMSFDCLKQSFGISGIEFDYNALVSSLPREWKTACKVKQVGPLMEPSLSFLVSRKRGNKHVYAKFIRKDAAGTSHTWENRWNTSFSNIAWSDVYENISRINYTRYRSFQYKIITRTHVTQKLLYRIGIVPSSHCNRCHQSIEDIEHKFWFCPVVQAFWKEIETWLLNNRLLERDINLDIRTVVFGLGPSSFLNHTIVAAKMIIASADLLRLSNLIGRLRYDRELEEVVASYKKDPTDFKNKWVRAAAALALCN